MTESIYSKTGTDNYILDYSIAPEWTKNMLLEYPCKNKGNVYSR